MASSGIQLLEQKQRLDSIQAKVIGLSPSPSLYAAMGAFISFGCKITEGDSATDFEILLDGQATGDDSHWNPDVVENPIRGFQYPNIAQLADGAFFTINLTHTMEGVPSVDLARYDIVYIFVGPTGPGLSSATGTPSEAVKADFIANGLVTTPYDSGTDAAIPVGAFPVARVYIADDSTGIADAQIADIRSFDGRLHGDPFTWDDMTPTQKQEIIDPASEAASEAVIADNEEFKRTMRTLHYLGI